MLLNSMVMDARLKLLVDPAWADIKHPVECPITAEDNQGLRKPAPNVDDDSPGDSATTVADFFGSEPIFGGGT